MCPNNGNPEIILLMSGKRKCGKDYIAAKLKKILNGKCTILRISEPIKRHYSETYNISLDELLSDGPLKENHRLDMIKWGEEMRSKDPGIFCKSACENASLTPVWIVTDIRRKTDIKYFKETYNEKIRTLRIVASENVRKSRSWVFTEGVDDAESECDLDDFKNWDLKIVNEDDHDEEGNMNKILNLLDIKQ